MATIPCDNPCIRCPPGPGGGIGPIDPDNPFVNLSSEAQDSGEFVANKHTPVFPPLLGTNWTSSGCLGQCISTVSQDEADLCATRQTVFCVTCCAPNPFDPDDPDPPTTEREVFLNTQKSCQFNCPDGTPFFFTVASGLFAEFSQLAADEAARTYACNKAAANLLCLGSLTPARACSNALYSGTVGTSSGNGPITFSIIGELPDGILMVQNETTAFFQGTVTTPGDYAWTVVAEDSLGNVMERLVTLTIFGVDTVALPDGQVGESYSATLQSGGTPSGTVVWSITMGTLPDGLTLNPATGEISGSPTTEETQTLQVTVTDGTLVCHKSLGIQIEEAGCIDWDLLAWQTATVVGVDGGTASFTPSNANSSTATSASAVTNDPASNAGAENFGTITYNGLLCSCQVDITWTNPIPGDGTTLVGYVKVETILAGTLFQFDMMSDLPSGVYTVMFDIPDTGGMNDTIFVSLVTSLNSLVDGARSQIASIQLFIP